MTQSWRLKSVASVAAQFEDKVNQFGLEPLHEVQMSALKAALGFLQVGVWALQNPARILKAISNHQPFTVFIGMRPPQRLHWGHLTLFKELEWLSKIGGEVFISLASFEADEQQNEFDSIRAANLLQETYESVCQSEFPKSVKVISDTDHFGIRKLQDRINSSLTVKEVMRIYGWNEQSKISSLQIPAITAASFLYPSTLFVDRPTLVLSDINQVAHTAIVKHAAKTLNLPVPSYSYRMLIPSLISSTERMSVNNPKSVIFLNDDKDVIDSKLRASFTGGRATVVEQQKFGGEPFKCSFFKIASTVLQNEQLDSIYEECTSGKVSCQECKRKCVPEIISKVSQ